MDKEIDDDALGIVLLPPIRIPKLVHDHLVELAKAKGVCIQAMARKILTDEVETWTEIREWAKDWDEQNSPEIVSERKGSRRRRVGEIDTREVEQWLEVKDVATDSAEGSNEKSVDDEIWWDWCIKWLESPLKHSQWKG